MSLLGSRTLFKMASGTKCSSPRPFHTDPYCWNLSPRAHRSCLCFLVLYIILHILHRSKSCNCWDPLSIGLFHHARTRNQCGADTSSQTPPTPFIFLTPPPSTPLLSELPSQQSLRSAKRVSTSQLRGMGLLHFVTD